MDGDYRSPQAGGVRQVQDSASQDHAAGWKAALLAFAAELDTAARRPAHPEATPAQARYASGTMQAAAELARQWAVSGSDNSAPSRLTSVILAGHALTAAGGNEKVAAALLGQALEALGSFGREPSGLRLVSPSSVMPTGKGEA